MNGDAGNPSGGSAEPSSKTILIVDDDEAILNLLEILVKRDGFKVLRAESGEAALYKLRKKPDAVLLDLMLPGSKSGIDVLRSFRQSGEPPPPVIVITGHSPENPQVKEAKEDPNVTHFIRKPIKQDHLLELLHRVLKTRAPERPSKEGGGGKDK